MAFDPKKLTTKTAEVITAALQSAKTHSNPELTADHVMAALTRQTATIVPMDFFKPEFVNRIDEIVRFRSLTMEDLGRTGIRHRFWGSATEAAHSENNCRPSGAAHLGGEGR